jgi:hypothetical protein
MRPETTSDWFLKLMDHDNFIPFAGMVVGVIAIVAAATVIITISRLWLTHRQRMAMIREGMHPDGGVHSDEMAVVDQSVPTATADAEKPIYKATG